MASFLPTTPVDEHVDMGTFDAVPSREKRVDSTETDLDLVDSGEGGNGTLLPEISAREQLNPLANESGQIRYNTMRWWNVGGLMVAETVSLGILSLPSALMVVGFIPGILLIIFLGIISAYSGYVFGQFKLVNNKCINMADAGEILFGRIGKELFAVASTLSFIFIMAAHLLTFTVMMNVITDHAQCTIIWGFVGLVLSLILTLPRKLENISWQSYLSFGSITVAVMIVMISLGTTNHGGDNLNLWPRTGPFNLKFIAVLDMVMAYAGNVAFFGFMAELADPKEFTKALVFNQTAATMFYIVVATVIYYYVGNDVKAPAITSADPLVAKISYGIAMPTIVIAGVINAAVAAKYLYARFWRDYKGRGDIMTENSFKALASWGIICVAIWVVAFCIAEAIPNFNNMLAFVSALFMGWLTYSVSGMLWLHMNRGKYFLNWKKTFLFVVNVLMVSAGAFMCIGGLYASLKELVGERAGPSFSCVDNSK